MVPGDEMGCIKLDIVFVGDYSGSVGGNEDFVVDAFQAFAKKFQISEADVKIGIVTFDDNAFLVCPLTSDSVIIRHKLNSLRHIAANSSSGTDITTGLSKADEVLYENGRLHVQKIVVLVSDGLQSNYADSTTTEVSNRLKRKGAIVCTVLIENVSARNAIMESIASPGYYVESSYGTLVDELKKLHLCR